MCYDPLFGNLYLKDEVVRELLDEHSAEPDHGSDPAEHGQDTERGHEPDDFDILTGDAAPE